MPSTGNQQHIFSVARFHCGCVYQALDDAVFCPEHRSSDPVGFITSQETIHIPGPGTPKIRELARHEHPTAWPKVLRSSENNSPHVRTSVRDGRDEEWADDDAREVGLCAACFIDDGEYNGTGMAMCECGDDGCSYRRCGRLDGLHALWRLHARGLSLEIAGVPEGDIFSHGG